MQASFPIGSILGIPIRVHVSWFIVLGLVTVAEAAQFSTMTSWPVAGAFGFVSAMLLFGSVLFHELGHSVVARAFGIHVRRIQLFLFGGVAEILGEPSRVLDEILIAAAGPFVSITLAFLAAPFAFLLLGHGLLAATALFFCGANALLFAFNMIPAFPTDGGRIARALLWAVLDDYRRATRWAAGLGIAFAALLVFGGIVDALYVRGAGGSGNWLGGAWMAMIGIFLARSARAGVEQARISAALRSGTVAEVMMPVRVLVPGEKTLFQVLTELGGPSAAEMLLGFAVEIDGACAGYVEPESLFAVPRERWGRTRAREVMTPLETMPKLPASTPLERLVRAMVETGAAGVLLFDGEQLVGYAGRGDVARFLVEQREAESRRDAADGGTPLPDGPDPKE